MSKDPNLKSEWSSIELNNLVNVLDVVIKAARDTKKYAKILARKSAVLNQEDIHLLYEKLADIDVEITDLSRRIIYFKKMSEAYMRAHEIGIVIKSLHPSLYPHINGDIDITFENYMLAFRTVSLQTRNRDESQLWKEFADLISSLATVNAIHYDRLDDFLKIVCSLTHARALDSIRTMKLIDFEIHSGAYRSAIRNLRFLLESIIQAYYIDKEYPDLGYFQKMDLPRVDMLRRRDLMKKCGFSETVYQLFRDLSKYVHSTQEELRVLVKELQEQEGALYFRFDEELFGRCVQLTIDVMDVFTFIFLELFPELTDRCRNAIAKSGSLQKALEKSTLKLICGKIRIA